jgi:hypothetical protein
MSLENKMSGILKRITRIIKNTLKNRSPKIDLWGTPEGSSKSIE